MARISTLVALIWLLVGASALTAPGAVASSSGSTSQVPAGWTLVTGGDVQASVVYALRYTRNSRYVSAELDYTGARYAMLRARATSIGPWENFELLWQSSTSSYVLQSTRNDRYVTAELDDTGIYQGMLRARATSIGSWQRFNLYYNASTGRYALQSKANSRYVAMEYDYTGTNEGMLRARSTSIGSWEQFVFV